MTPAEFVAACQSYRGVRYWHKGRSRTGVDCAGLPVCAARDCGAAPHDDLNYQEHVDAARFRAGLLVDCREVPAGEVAPGDLLLFRARDGNAQHLAVLTAPGRMIHAWDSADKVCEHPLTRGWLAQLEAVFRWRDW